MTRIQRVIMATLIVAVIEGGASVALLALGNGNRSAIEFGAPGARGFIAALALGLSSL
jgi:hypothetical protein